MASSPALKALVMITIWTCVMAAATFASADDGPPISIPAVSLVYKLHEQDFSDEAIAQIFADPRIRLYPQIVDKQSWHTNHLHKMAGFLKKKSISRGRKLLLENDGFFRKLEGLYGVEKEAIMAIFRVETNLGSYVGKYPVFNSLLTIATLPNRRSEWAEEELVHFVVICRDLRKEPLSIKGSWAGAFGLCQFVPSSFRAYAVDGDNDGAVDLFNFFDAMASIANYLRANGWQNGDETEQRRAVYTYNHSQSYVEAILAYTKATKVKS